MRIRRKFPGSGLVPNIRNAFTLYVTESKKTEYNVQGALSESRVNTKVHTLARHTMQSNKQIVSEDIRTRSQTNQAKKPNKMARGLKFLIPVYNVDQLYRKKGYVFTRAKNGFSLDGAQIVLLCKGRHNILMTNTVMLSAR